jgi:hypothetical protein
LLLQKQRLKSKLSDKLKGEEAKVFNTIREGPNTGKEKIITN